MRCHVQPRYISFQQLLQLRSWRMSSLLLVISFLLVACGGNSQAPRATSALPPAYAYTPLSKLLAAPGGSAVTTAGYFYDMGDGAVLIDHLSFSGEQPAPLADQSDQQVWLGEVATSELGSNLRTSGSVRYAPLLATGRVEGPGAYGPGGRYQFQLSAPVLSPLSATVVTITGLLSKTLGYDGQFVRVKGNLLVSGENALLVEEIGSGGVPPVLARQVKLAEPVRDKLLLARLTTSGGGKARYGPVEIEGFWRSGELLAFGIMPDT